MINYSTNFMGPIALWWYQERGLTEIADVTVDSKILAEVYGVELGGTVTQEVVTEYWCGGRIDIYGLDETEYYGGRSEYSLPVMDGVSWNVFSNWLENYETVELETFEQLLSAFEADTNHKIRWAHKEFGDIGK